MRFEALNADNQTEVRALILDGLQEHWGSIDESMNPDLLDMVATYGHGRTVLARNDEGDLIGTGTIVPAGEHQAEILRMSVKKVARRSGIGRLILMELIETARSWSMASVILETSTAWTDVIEFYTNCGFVVTHVEDGPFGNDTWFKLSLTN